jgi:hypothetical protein
MNAKAQYIVCDNVEQALGKEDISGFFSRKQSSYGGNESDYTLLQKNTTLNTHLIKCG